jgi:hypothetical protein
MTLFSITPKCFPNSIPTPKGKLTKLPYKSPNPQTPSQSQQPNHNIPLNPRIQINLDLQIQLNLNTQAIIHRLIRTFLNPAFSNNSWAITFCSWRNDTAFVDFFEGVGLGLLLLLLLLLGCDGLALLDLLVGDCHFDEFELGWDLGFVRFLREGGVGEVGIYLDLWVLCTVLAVQRRAERTKSNSRISQSSQLSFSKRSRYYSAIIREMSHLQSLPSQASLFSPLDINSCFHTTYCVLSQGSCPIVVQPSTDLDYIIAILTVDGFGYMSYGWLENWF